MSQYCKPLNLNLQVVANQSILEDFKKQYMSFIDANNVLHPDFKEFLKSKNVYAHHVEAFYSPPNFEQPIHIDDQGGDYTKINFVWGGTDSIMHWYTPKEGLTIEPKVTPIDTKYFGFEKDEVNLLESAVVHSPSLIQVGIPHNITNPNEHRLCVSVVICHNDESRITMQEASSIFSEYLVA